MVTLFWFLPPPYLIIILFSLVSALILILFVINLPLPNSCWIPSCCTMMMFYLPCILLGTSKDSLMIDTSGRKISQLGKLSCKPLAKSVPRTIGSLKIFYSLTFKLLSLMFRLTLLMHANLLNQAIATKDALSKHQQTKIHGARICSRINWI